MSKLLSHQSISSLNLFYFPIQGLIQTLQHNNPGMGVPGKETEHNTYTKILHLQCLLVWNFRTVLGFAALSQKK